MVGGTELGLYLKGLAVSRVIFSRHEKPIAFAARNSRFSKELDDALGTLLGFCMGHRLVYLLREGCRTAAFAPDDVVVCEVKAQTVFGIFQKHESQLLARKAVVRRESYNL